jgi:hypothetical protein
VHRKTDHILPTSSLASCKYYYVEKSPPYLKKNIRWKLYQLSDERSQEGEDNYRLKERMYVDYPIFIF